MAIYEVSDSALTAVERTTFAESDIKEQQQLQQLLKKQVGVVSPDTLVISEEFSSWDSQRRIDLLGIDRNANLVVIELKRTEKGGHMELQALRYAAMVSTITFEQAVEIYDRYLRKEGVDKDARQSLLEFLGWGSEEEQDFAQDIRIVLASADFSKEIMSTVLWLNDNGLDIRCVRMQPYRDGDRVLLDIEQAIPLPEAEEYQVQVKQKGRREKAAREDFRDFSKYTIKFAGQVHESLGKGRSILCVVKAIFDSGVDGDAIAKAVTERKNIICSFDGELSEDELKAQIVQRWSEDGLRRWFYKKSDPMMRDGKTWLLTNQWGTTTKRAIDDLIDAFPDLNITYEISR